MVKPLERIPKIEKRKIIETKPSGWTQYFLTLPKAYAKALKAKGERDLLVVYDGVLIAFPANTVTENELLTFLKLHPELLKLIIKEA
ncbi:MAG: hypothetical protein QW175_05745 [Candidatus Bathyarchaeia archaeon]